ncbi:hypothetical protein IT412_01315 [Candidatus Peregrinibacteria bacterium]|nr:hypothetical protein [Candidatus Peregrinibacteria bacterium]
MNYKEIVAEAWQFTQTNKRLAVWYGAVPAFFTTLIGMCYIVYQYYAFLSSQLFQHWNRSFLSLVATTVLDFIKTHTGMIAPLLVLAVIIALGYFIIPVICQGALIQMIARRKNGQQVPGRKGFNYGFITFLPLFEYRLFVQTFSIFSLFSMTATATRNFGWKVLWILIPIFIFLVIVALIVAILFTYSEFFIVIDGESVFSSIAKSVGLVTRHLEETVLLTILMLIISLRIIIQILFVLIIPAAGIGVVYLLAAANLPTLGLLLGSLLALVGVGVASYLNGIVHTFAMAVWTFTFLHLTSKTETHARDKAEEEANVNQGGQE